MSVYLLQDAESDELFRSRAREVSMTDRLTVKSSVRIGSTTSDIILDKSIQCKWRLHKVTNDLNNDSQKLEYIMNFDIHSQFLTYES